MSIREGYYAEQAAQEVGQNQWTGLLTGIMFALLEVAAAIDRQNRGST